MDITITQKAVDDGVLRVWLRRIPQDSGIVFAFRTGVPDETSPVSEAYIYGHGEGSTASQKVMLLFRLPADRFKEELLAGSKLSLKKRDENSGRYIDIDLDVIDVE